MKLYASTRSPFCRKVFVAARELGLLHRLEIQPVVVSQTLVDPALLAVHPLGQIPVLVLDDGQVVHDSLVICEYLDALAGGDRLLPVRGAGRWEVLGRHALGQAMLETLVKLFSERKRDADPLQPAFVDAFRSKFLRTLPGLDAASRSAAERFDLGDIAIGCALAYADFRFPALDWRAGHRALEAYYARIAARPSMRESVLAGEPTRGLHSA